MNRSTSLITVRGIVFSAVFAALMIAMSWVNIQLGFSPVPITLENMAPMLAGAFLGPLYGFLSIFLVVFFTAIGLPLLHGTGGLALVLGPTGGFIWMFPIQALLIGLIVTRIRGSNLAAYVKVFIAIWICSMTVFLVGVPWLAHSAKLTLQQAMASGCYPFLLGDTLKVITATLIVIPVRRIFPVSRLVGGKESQVVDLRS